MRTKLYWCQCASYYLKRCYQVFGISLEKLKKGNVHWVSLSHKTLLYNRTSKKQTCQVPEPTLHLVNWYNHTHKNHENAHVFFLTTWTVEKRHSRLWENLPTTGWHNSIEDMVPVTVNAVIMLGLAAIQQWARQTERTQNAASVEPENSSRFDTWGHNCNSSWLAHCQMLEFQLKNFPTEFKNIDLHWIHIACILLTISFMYFFVKT